MLTIYVSAREQNVVTDDGVHMTTKTTFVRKGSEFAEFQDVEISSDIKDVEVIFISEFFRKKLTLPSDVKDAMLTFLKTYHGKGDLSFDCYAFANLVKGIPPHGVSSMLRYWKLRPLFWRPKVGGVVFFTSGINCFHHAAIYLGRGLYISVWGAGGDIEIATKKSIKRDFSAEYVSVAKPL